MPGLSDADVGLAPLQPQLMPAATQPTPPARTPNLTAAVNPQQQSGGLSDADVGLASFGSDDYIKGLATKYGATPDYVRGLAESETGGAGLRGIPLLGGLVNRAGAGLASLTGNVPSYGKGLELENELQRDYESAHPVESTAAGIVGGTAATAPLGATAIGRQLLGLTGASLPGMVLRGATAGAAINAADAAIRGSDPEAGAIVGGITGAAAPVVGRALGGMLTGARNMINGPSRAIPQNISRVAGVDVPLSSGQAAADQTSQQFEQTALRGGFGPDAQRIAQGFFEGRQAPALEQARASVGQELDPHRLPLAESPNEAGDIVAQRVRQVAAQSRGNVQNLYNMALSAPGEFHAATFEGIGQRIKGDLTLSRSPVVIDDVTTPVASRMIQHIDNSIGRMRIQNRADPFGAPNPENIVGVNMAGVDQARKQLVSMADATQYGSADARAARRIIGAFDDRVESALSDGLFSGDDSVLDQIRAARAAYREHVRTFESQSGDWGTGLAMEKIIGRNGGDGATPEQVANYLYGNAKIGATDLSQHLAARMRDVLGAQSPEWSALRQGLWAKLTAPTEGVTNRMGPQMVANRINEFLNGSGRTTANMMFSPAEQALMRRYANLLNQVTPLPGTVNYSNTAPVLKMIMDQTLNGLSVMLGAHAAGPIGAFAGLGARAAGEALRSRSTTGAVARSLYNTPAANRANMMFANQMARYAATGSRGLIGAEDQKRAVNQ